MQQTFISSKKTECDRCRKQVPAYYTLSFLTKGLFVQCPTDGTHARPYIPNLDLPEKPSKHYLTHLHDKIPPKPFSQTFHFVRHKQIVLEDTPLVRRVKIVRATL